jgi:hypothetical protein
MDHSCRSGSGSREHPLVMMDSENAMFCPQFPENRAVHLSLWLKDICVTVSGGSDVKLLLI